MKWLNYGVLLAVCFFSAPLFSEQIPLTILATGDIHSHFDPSVDPYHMGGLDRLKAAMDHVEGEKVEAGHPVLRLDAGDCSEGTIFFNLTEAVDPERLAAEEDPGKRQALKEKLQKEVRPSASFEMLNHLDYDAIVLGNHDWYLGEDLLNSVLKASQPKFSFISANLDFRQTPDHELKQQLKPYEVFYLVGGEFLRKGQYGFEPDPEVNYFKVGVFGLSTHEIFYAIFFDKVGIRTPRAVVNPVIARLLKNEKVDVVVMLSHMLDEDDLTIARSEASKIDLIIGGHSHNKVIPRDGKPIEVRIVEDEDDNPEEAETTWVVKAGEFGQYFSQIDLVYDTVHEKVIWGDSSYELHQVDGRHGSDSFVKGFIAQKKRELNQKYQGKFYSEDEERDIFSDKIARSEIDMFRNGATESYLGNLVSNALLHKAREAGHEVDFGVNNSQFLSHGLYRGPIHTAMIYNMFPLIYDPVKNKSWTVWTFSITGQDLKMALEAVLGMNLFFDVAGMEVIYDPTASVQVVDVLYNGEKLQDDKTYHVATSRGVIRALDFMHDQWPSAEFQDTGIEVWDALRDYMKTQSPLRADNEDIRVSGRIKTVQPDLGIFSEDMVVTPVTEDNLNKLFIQIDVVNLGYADLSEEEALSANTNATVLQLFYDATPNYTVDDISVFKPLNSLFAEKDYQLNRYIRHFIPWSPSLEDVIFSDAMTTLSEAGVHNVKKLADVVVPSLGKGVRKTVSVKWDVSQLAPTDYPYTLYLYLAPTVGTSYVTVPDEDAVESGDQKKREFVMDIKETNVENNKAKAYVYLNQMRPLMPSFLDDPFGE